MVRMKKILYNLELTNIVEDRKSLKKINRIIVIKFF